MSRDRALQVSDDVDATGNARAWLRRAFPDSEVVEGEVCASVLPIAHLDRCVICGALVVPAPASLRHGWSTVCRSCSEAKLDAKLLGMTDEVPVPASASSRRPVRDATEGPMRDDTWVVTSLCSPNSQGHDLSRVDGVGGRQMESADGFIGSGTIATWTSW